MRTVQYLRLLLALALGLGGCGVPEEGYVLVAAGADVACALDSSGVPSCWGRGFPGCERTEAGCPEFDELTLRPPPEDVRFSGLGVFDWQGCGVEVDGQALHCWSGPVLDFVIEPVSEVVVSGDTVCTIDSDGLALCASRREDPSGPVEPVSAVALAGGTRCGISRLDGRAVCWEIDQEGLVPPPVVLTSLSLSTGGTGCGIDEQGELMCWGVPPSESPPSGRFVDVEVGVGSACAQRPAGTVECWSINDAWTQVPQPPATRFLQFSIGAGYGCGVTRQRDLQCWGYSPFGAHVPVP